MEGELFRWINNETEGAGVLKTTSAKRGLET